MFTHLRQVLGGIAPVDQALALLMTHRQPVTELELDACQIKFAANT